MSVTKEIIEDSWVTSGPSSFYSEACVWFNFAKEGQVLVVKFSQWLKWYNEARFSRARIVPPMPAFCGDNYQVANQVRDELNQSSQEIREGKN